MKKTVLLLVGMFCLSFMLLTSCPSVGLTKTVRAESRSAEVEEKEVLVDGRLFNDPQGRLDFNRMKFAEDIE